MMGQTDKLIEEILQPGMEFSPIPFWFFNDAFEEEKVRRQLEDYVEKGVGGFVLHPRIGVPKEMPYLSEAYFRAVRFIVKTASELGMKVVLYDEGMYPSGSAHGMVVDENPEYASKGIILLGPEEAEEKLGRERSARLIVALPDGRQIVYGFTGGTIRGIHFGEDDGQPGAPKAADILNPDAVEAFIRLTHDRYYEELKEYFGTTVIAFFTDEPSALGRNAEQYRPWVPGLEKELEAAGGCLEELEGLFAHTGKTVAGRADLAETVENDTVRLYRQLIKRKLREIFYARLSRWCEGHGISLIGHPAESDDIEEELYFHIPGQDLVMRRVAPETGGLREFDSVQAKLSADIARHLGRRRNANECFGVCCRDRIPWYMTAGDMKWYIDWLGLRGVNLYIPHAFYYSVAGERKEERPPDVGPNNIWWEHYRRFSDYMKRLSYLMTDSVNGARFAVLCDNNRVPYEEIAGLYESQVEFNYLPAALLEQAVVGDGRVRIQGYAYEGVLNLLGQEYEERFRERLGSLLWTASDEAYRELLSGKTGANPGGAQGCGTGLGSPVRLKEPCPNLRKVSLRKYGTDMVLFGNEGSRAICTEVTVEGMASPLFVDLWHGTCYTVEGAGETFVLSLRPSETLLVVCRGAEKGTEEEKGAGAAQTAAFSGPEDRTQKAGREKEMPGIRTEARRADWYRAEYPDWTDRFVLQEKSANRAVYVCSLEYHGGLGDAENAAEAEAAPAGQAGAYGPEDFAATGPVRFAVRGEEMVECFCNGSFVDVSFWGEHRFVLEGCLKEGCNEIRLVVTGNAANRYEDAGIPFGLGTGGR